MADKWLQAFGQSVAFKNLKIEKAIEFAAFLKSNANPYARFIEARKADMGEIIVFEVEVELGQLQVHPIKGIERLEIIFFETDSLPEVRALREDFPSVPHINTRPHAIPRSLCLYDENYNDLKRSWTAPRVLERIRTWLALTAKGKLHAEDQPLEPLIEASTYTIALPEEILFKTSRTLDRITVRYASEDKTAGLLVAEESDDKNKKTGLDVLVTVFDCPPQTHGVIQHKPSNLAELHSLVAQAGLDLVGELRKRLEFWKQNDYILLNSKLIIIITLPKTRTPGGKAEIMEVRAFLIAKTIAEIGSAVGMWDFVGGQIGVLLRADTTKNGATVDIDMANVTYNLSRKSAAQMNGVVANEEKFAAIGAGAIGSHILMNLIRAGFGTWTVIDNDILLPHNLARHALDGRFIGWKKARSLQTVANSLYGASAISNFFDADVLNSTDKPEMEKALSESRAIVDFSASVSVARHLACDLPAKARRVSLFLNPSGTDLVVLGEDKNRRVRLDALEMQYYRALSNQTNLAGHLKRPAGKLRYAQSCRDVSSDIPQDCVAVLAGVGSRAIRKTLADDGAVAAIWRTENDSLTVRKFAIPTSKPRFIRLGEWTVCTDELLLDEIFALRKSKLPKETGGVLLGSYDLERKIIYVFQSIPSPPDSEEWPTVYVRGNNGLAAKIKEVSERTAEMVQYVGEWHSHPNGCSCSPSTTDRKAFNELAEHRSRDGLPACMMIAGERNRFAIYLGEMR